MSSSLYWYVRRGKYLLLEPIPIHPTIRPTRPPSPPSPTPEPGGCVFGSPPFWTNYSGAQYYVRNIVMSK